MGSSTTKFYYALASLGHHQIFHLEIVLKFDLTLPTFLVSCHLDANHNFKGRSSVQ